MAALTGADALDDEVKIRAAFPSELFTPANLGIDPEGVREGVGEEVELDTAGALELSLGETDIESSTEGGGGGTNQ